MNKKLLALSGLLVMAGVTMLCCHKAHALPISQTRWRFEPITINCWEYGLYAPPTGPGEYINDTPTPITLDPGSAFSVFLQPSCCPTFPWQGSNTQVGYIWQEVYIPGPGGGWTLVPSTFAPIYVFANCAAETWYLAPDGSGIDNHTQEYCLNQ